jgi:Family of unknown function (DUF6455)
MDINLSDTQIALIITVVAAALVVWFRNTIAAASRSRMYRMMAKLGVDPNKLGRAAGSASASVETVRTRCRMCPSEDVCERWLSGEIEGDNGFCPNARIFDGVLKAG